MSHNIYRNRRDLGELPSTQGLLATSYSRYVYNGYKYDSNPLIDRILIDYLDVRNTHYSESYKQWALSIIKNWLQPTYIDSSTTGYAYNTFIIGQNKTTADFFYLFRFNSNLIENDALEGMHGIDRIDIEGIIYNQRYLPNHTYLGTGYIIASHSAAFSSFNTIFRIQSNHLIGELSYINNQFISYYQFRNNQLSNKIPNSNIRAQYYWFQNNTSITDIDGYAFIHTNALDYNLSNCSLSLASVNGLFQNLNNYFSSNAPIKNLFVNISGGSNASPTGGINNTDIVSLGDIYLANSKFLSITIN